MICLMMSFVSSCETLKQTISSEEGLDLCKSDIDPITFNDAELNVLQSKNLKKVAVLNCTLYKICKRDIPNAKLCPK